MLRVKSSSKSRSKSRSIKKKKSFSLSYSDDGEQMKSWHTVKRRFERKGKMMPYEAQKTKARQSSSRRKDRSVTKKKQARSESEQSYGEQLMGTLCTTRKTIGNAANYAYQTFAKPVNYAVENVAKPAMERVCFILEISFTYSLFYSSAQVCLVRQLKKKSRSEESRSDRVRRRQVTIFYDLICFLASRRKEVDLHSMSQAEARVPVRKGLIGDLIY